MPKKFYLTSALSYVNALPHIGHAMQFVRADVLARYRRLKGDDVFFLTGTDEYGSKIYRTAKAESISPKELANKNAAKFKLLDKLLNISYDGFIRTTDKKHASNAKKIWALLEKNGDIYKKKYQGLYCVGCEAFKTEKDLIDGKCPDHQIKPEIIEEENYFFRLSKYAKKIELKIRNNELRIIPESRKNEILSFIKEGVEDVSFSRPKKVLPWGIPVSSDKKQIIYVWADALTGYLFPSQYWPADLHIIGKDNLKFLALYWPAMLISAGLALPKKIYVHGFITSGGLKMSKTIGNVVDPFEMLEKYGADALRYYLLREIPAYEDGDFTESRFKERYNGELANGLGNFTARVLTLASQARINAELMQINAEIKKKIILTKKQVDQKIEEFKFNEALAAIWELISFGDNYINQTAPWKIKDEKDKKEKSKVIFNLVMLLKEIAGLLQLFLPQTSEKILKNIKISKKIIKIKKGDILFPRI
ncbi:MAG: methionine--tRNA ligase [Patescibacteria group bacterium]